MNDNLKQIIWIDDDTFAMKKVVDYLFAQLWDNHIKSFIYILKNNNEMADDLNATIYDRFIYFLIDKNFIFDEEKCKPYNRLLISSEQNRNTSGSDITKSSNDNIFSSTASKEELTQKILKNIHLSSTWFSNDQNSATDLTNASSDQNMDSENTWHGIDLCLQKDDFNILRDHKKDMAPQPNENLLSMNLYNKLITENKKAFLYSTYDIPNDIIEAWMELYYHFYDDKDDKREKKDPCVYNRKGKLAYSDSKNAQNLLDLIMEESKNDKGIGNKQAVLNIQDNG